MELLFGKMVLMHLASGDWPALVNKTNPDGTVNLTVFTSGELIFRNSVPAYDFDPEDEADDKIGYWEAMGA